jgi:agmatinase
VIHKYVYEKVSETIADERLVVLIGGEHSLSYGSIRAHLEHFPNMQVIQLDAHMDLRNAYEGLQYSHASVFYNVLRDLPLSALFQIGIRDYCREEWTFFKENERINVLTAEDIADKKAEGEAIKKILSDFLQTISNEVYLSLDIDVLEPHLCPGTGTPVPGGLSFWDVLQLVHCLHSAGKKIVGFDLVETGGQTYIDGFTSAKLIYMIATRVYSHNNPASGKN